MTRLVVPLPAGTRVCFTFVGEFMIGRVGGVVPHPTGCFAYLVNVDDEPYTVPSHLVRKVSDDATVGHEFGSA